MTVRPRPAYAHGAVKEATDTTLLRKIKELEQAVPISKQHRNLLRELGSEFVYVRELESSGRDVGWLVLVRFGSVLEQRFGLTREIPLVYSPFNDLQIRTIDGLGERLKSLPHERRSVTTQEVLVWAPDSRLVEKLDNWSRAARVLLPMPSERELEHIEFLQRFIDLLASRLASRDLYSARGYVTGDQFFGRAAEIQQVADSVRQREAVGIFGLRKTGKTSLLNELKLSYNNEKDASDRKQLFVYQDLEHLPSLSEDPVTELVQDLADNIRRRLKEEGLRTQELADLPDDASPSDFRRAVDRILEKEEQRVTLVLLLDEIEYLCPPNPGPDTTGIGFQRVRQLFGGLRKLVQERENFAFVLAGLSNSAIESAELYGEPNPLFSFARPLYLGPFDIREAEGLLNGIGKKVSLHWTEDAIRLSHEVTGGHALLIRELASAVLQAQRSARVNTVQIRPGMVHSVIPQWKSAVASHVREVLPHLRRYYPDEADLAVMLMDNPRDFGDFAQQYGANVNRLVSLGIVSRHPDGQWGPTPLLVFSHEFEKRPAPDRTSTSSSGERTADELVREDESEVLERKESLRAHGGPIPDDKVVDQVLKACLGFLNHRGGDVVVGVSDAGHIVGVERDINLCGSEDRMLLFLSAKLTDKIGNTAIDLIRPRLETVDEMKVLIISVMPSREPVFPKSPVDGKEGLFVRNNNQTAHLTTRDAVQYIQRRWSNQ